MEMNDIKKLCQKDIREAKKVLAFEVTKHVHSEEVVLKAKTIAEELFSNKTAPDNMSSILSRKKNLELML